MLQTDILTIAGNSCSNIEPHHCSVLGYRLYKFSFF